MSDFEFQRYVNIGQYLPRESPVHRLDPRVRLVCGFILLTAITAAPNLTGLGLALLVALGLIALAQLPMGYTLRGLLPPLPFVLFLVVLQILLGPRVESDPTILTWGPIRVSTASIVDGIKILLRFAGLILSISIFSYVTSTTEMVRGLEALTRPLGRLGLPVQDFVLMVQVALRFLPLLAREAERIAKSQASRGADWGTGRGGLVRRVRQSLPILVPLFLVGLQRAENLALAMEARGYQGQRRRTSLIEMHLGPQDILALLAMAAAAALILLI